jgi:hypothetical protein
MADSRKFIATKVATATPPVLLVPYSLFDASVSSTKWINPFAQFGKLDDRASSWSLLAFFGNRALSQ